MDEELRKEVADYFDAYELVELLGIKAEQIIAEFSDEVEDALDDLCEIMQVARPTEEDE